MALASGARIGPYHVDAPLGSGGMGEVYRATDTNLGRQVAIKVLPASLADDPDRLARFDREARTLAALNHPNIAAIYGIERTGSASALIMELVEGPTLADRIAHGVIPIDEALEIARQIAEALEAAHEQGIVHRDLKPANIKVRPDRTVKVLDFGLAKAIDPAVAISSAGVSRSPTITSPVVTGAGAVLGTAAYMSPEQARGQAVDGRADIWALGAVMFEMLSGRRPFAGGTVVDTLAAILDREPEWGALPTVPAPVAQLLRRCLRKRAHERLRHVADVRIHIEDAIAGLRSHEDESPATSRTPTTSPRWAVAAIATAALGAGVIAGFLWRAAAPSPAASPTLDAMTRLTSDAGLSTEPSLTPDGRLLAYASNRGAGNLDIYVQQTDGGSAIRLTDDPADDRQPDVSPDGTLVAFHSDRVPRGIYLAPALGGAARLIAADGFGPQFSPDGRSVAFWTGNWLASRGLNQPQRTLVVPALGGTPAAIATNIASAGHPVWAPDGRSLLVFGREAISGAATDPDWWWVPIDGGAATRTGAFRRFAESGISVNVVRTMPYPQSWTGAGVFFSADSGNGDTRSVWLVGLDPASGRVIEPPVRLTNGSTSDSSLDVSPSGRTALSAQTVTRNTFALPLDDATGRPTGPLRRVRQDNAPSGRVSVAENGLLLAVPLIEAASSGIWVRDVTTGHERQIVATRRTPLNPVISADGQWIAYTVTARDLGGDDGPGDGFVVPTSGGVPRRVCELCQIAGWTRDNRQVIIGERDLPALVRVDIASGAHLPLVIGTKQAPNRPMFGPAGGWVVFNVAGEAYVAPVHSDRPTVQSEWMKAYEGSPSATAERAAGLSPDGRLLYVLLERDSFRCLYAIRLDPKTGRPQGMPFLVQHYHDATKQWGSTGMGSAVARGMFVADLFDTSGNIWLTAVRRSDH
jgi:serine/threonine protein kinase/Tol biopolymer transport system component